MTLTRDLAPDCPTPAPDACPECHGEGRVPEVVVRVSSAAGLWRWVACVACGGDGRALRQMSALCADEGEG